LARVKKSIKINAPVEKVFEYVNNPKNLPEIWPSLEKVNNIKELPNGGHSFDWEYKMAGMHFKGSTDVVEVVPNEHTVSISTGGIESTLIWEYQAVEDGMIFTDNTEYRMPIPLLGKLAESFIAKVNENESEVFLANLKAKMEA
jgi:uncharacterized membrane protein